MTVHGTTQVLVGLWVLRGAALLLGWAALRHARHALELGLPETQLLWLAPLGLGLGWFKARRVMDRPLAANEAWLRARPRVPAWRVFPPWLLALIACMVGLSLWLKQVLANHAWGLAGLGTLDLAVAAALLLAAAGRRAPLAR